MMKKDFFLIGLLLLLSICGCTQKVAEDQKEYIVYYIDNTETRLVEEKFLIDEDDEQEVVVVKLINKLAGVPNNLTCKRVLPENLSIKREDISLDAFGRLTIKFPELYYQTTGIKEILCRSAIIKTICQVNGVNNVQFYVRDYPLTDENEKEIGFMSDKDFLYRIE